MSLSEKRIAKEQQRKTGYTPNNLLDEVKKETAVFTDKSLAKLLDIPSNEICDLRCMRRALSERHILRIYHVTGWGIDYIRHLAGDDSEEFYKPPSGGPDNLRWSRNG